MDAHLRSLEREAAQGNPDESAKLLLQRVRSGTLPRKRVELAASLGHDVAWQVISGPDSPRQPALSESEARERMAEILATTLSKPECVSFLCDCAERLLPTWEAYDSGDRRPHRAIELARAWTRDQSPRRGTIRQASVDAHNAGRAANLDDYRVAEVAKAASVAAGVIGVKKTRAWELLEDFFTSIAMCAAPNEWAWQRNHLCDCLLGQLGAH